MTGTTSTITLSDKSKAYLKELTALCPQGNFTQLHKSGLPTKKVENYKYTNLDKTLANSFSINTSEKLPGNFDQVLNATPGAVKLVFINGKLSKERSLLPSSGLVINEATKNSEKLELKDPFEEITYYASPSKYQFIVEKNATLPLVTLMHFCEGQNEGTSLSSVEITVEQGANVHFMEVFQNSDEGTEIPSTLKGQSFSRTKLDCKENSHVGLTQVVLTQLCHTHVCNMTAELSRDAQFYGLTFSAAGGINRNNLEVNIRGAGAHATVNGLYTGRSTQHQDSFSNIHHYAGHTTSNQLFKGILDDESRGVFTGKIVIHRDAQQVDSSQLNKNLLLSKKAHVDTRPQIEVYADDVKCGHGATVGQINEEEIFYLESRGIEKSKAQKILCHAFGQEVIETCEQKEIKTFLSAKLFELFEKFALEHLEEKLQ